jgi:solute:Na+ symporter, SSS family
MELALIDWIIIVVYFIVSLVIGLWYSKTAGKGISEFFLGGRNLTWWVAGVSMVATTFAADTPLAVTELVTQNGIAGNWLWWNMLLGGMLTVFFFAKLWRRADILTDVEFIEIRYSGKEAAFLRGFRALYLGLFMNSLIIGWVNIALVSILQVFFNIPQEQALFYVAGAMFVTVFYSSLSGLLGVAVTDFVQFIIAMSGCIYLAVVVVNSEKIGGIDGLKEKLNTLSPGSLEFFPHVGQASSGDLAQTLTLSVGAFFAFTTIQWWASWYPGAEPGGGGYIAQRMMSTKNERHAILSTLFFQIAHYCLRPWPWILVGLCAIILYPELSAEDKKLGYVFAMKEFLPPGMRGFLLVAFLAAYMSTIATQLNWGASYLVNDFYKRFVKPASSEKHLVLISRLVTLLMMVIALYATSRITSISGVWQFIMECGAGLGLVLILRWYWWRVNAWSEIIATIAPFVAYGTCKYLGIEYPQSFFITVGFTTITWIAGTFATAPTNMEKLKSFYSKIRPGGLWEPVRKAAGAPEKKSDFGTIAACWASSIVMCYSILFLFGKLLLKEWNEVLILSVTSVISFIILLYLSRKVKIFED